MHTETYHAFMLDHAAGALPPALRVAGDIHAAMDLNGAEETALWDCIGGVLLDDMLNAAAPTRFSASDGRARARAKGAGRAITVDAAAILETDLDTLKWRRGLAGVDYARSGVPLGQFMRLGAGQQTPEHGHSALEATVVLRGELIVDETVCSAGQLVIGSPGDRHQPVGGACDVCICYVGREQRPFWRLS